MAKTPELQRFYASQKWQNLRRRLILESGGVCSCCGEIITDPSDLVAHHKKELTPENYKDPRISLNPENIEILCWHCHSKHHARERDTLHMQKKVYVVWGCYCAGKSTYVKEQAGPDDLIVDMDSIFSSISILPSHCHSKAVQACAFAVRDCLLDKIRTRTGRWSTAWIIGGYPRLKEREDLLCRLRADDIYIGSSRAECEARAAERDPLCRDEMMRAIADWWETAQGIPLDTEDQEDLGGRE